MNLKKDIILIEHGNYSEIKSAIEEWIELYIDSLDEKVVIKLYQLGEDKIVVELNKTIENAQFNYLVNYLTYPENTKSHAIVTGYTTTKDKKLFPQNKLNQAIQIFIPADDTQYDLVQGILKSGETFRLEFGGKTIAIDSEVKYNEPKLEYIKIKPHIIKINKSERNDQILKSSIAKFKFRYNIIAGILVPGTIISAYLTFDTEYFITVVKISSFSLFFWTMLEYDLIHNKSVFLRLFTISLFFAVLGYYSETGTLDDVWLKSSKMSLFFLIIYQALKYVFVIVFKREPVFYSNKDKIADRVYSIILLLGTALSSMLL